MDRKVASMLASLIILIVIVPVVLSAEISVGVKQGDWIEYQTNVTGTPPPDHNVAWARMEITDVQGVDINLNVTTKFFNGTSLNEAITLNLETGQLGDDFIIPANLNGGGAFFDKRVGNITINGLEERTYGGATRTVVYADTSQTKFYWDKLTGILVEAFSTYSDYTMHTTVDKTNMWQASQIFGLDSTLFYALIIVAVAIIAAIIFFVIRRKK
jgi:hypothetical protein